MRPVVELMFADFMGVCLDQIYNHMAKIHFESGGHVTVPMVLTMAVGGGYSDGAQHSQCLWGTFAHLPGMKVVVPSNPADAKGLMTAAIRDDGPVVYMFHKGVMGLPWMARTPAPSQTCRRASTSSRSARRPWRGRAGTSPSSRSRCRCTTRWMSPRRSQPTAIDVEVIDLRSLVPLDRDAILTSVAKTGRLVVVDEDYRSFGLSGEVVATVTDHDPTMLKVPVQRVAVPDVPIPYAHVLEYACFHVTIGSRPQCARGGHMTDVLFPALSKESPQAVGVLATWFVREGATVSAAQLIAEVQVDKVAAEVVAPWPGSSTCSSTRRPRWPRGRPSPGSSRDPGQAGAVVPGRFARQQERDPSPTSPKAANAAIAAAYAPWVSPATRIVPAIAVPRDEPRFDTLRDKRRSRPEDPPEAGLDDVHRRGEHAAEPEPDEEEPGHEGPGARRRSDHDDEQGDSPDGEDEARHDERPLGAAPGEALRAEGGEEQADRRRGEDHAGLDGVVAAHDLEVCRDRERHPQEHQPLDVLGDEAQVGGPLPEQRRRKQWFDAGAFLGAHLGEEPHEDERAGEDQARRQPDVGVRSQDPHDDENEAGRGQDSPERVEGAGRVGRNRVLDPPAQPQDHGDDQRLEHERCPPADRGGDQAADEWTGCGADATHRADRSEGPRAGGELGEEQGREDVDRRDQQGRPDALEDRVAEDRMPSPGETALSRAPMA